MNAWDDGSTLVEWNEKQDGLMLLAFGKILLTSEIYSVTELKEMSNFESAFYFQLWVKVAA